MATGVFHFPRQNEHAAADREMIYEDRHRIVNVSTARTQRLIGINQADDSHQRLLAAEALARAAKAKDPRTKPTFGVLSGASLAHGLSESMTSGLDSTVRTAAPNAIERNALPSMADMSPIKQGTSSTTHAPDSSVADARATLEKARTDLSVAAAQAARHQVKFDQAKRRKGAA